MIVRPSISTSLTLTPRFRLPDQPPETLNLSPYLRSLTRSKTINGAGIGTWAATLKFPANEAGQAERRRLEAYLRDDDWGFLSFDDDSTGRRSVWEVLTDARARSESSDDRGAWTADYKVSGYDWSRCMSQGEVRLGSTFQSAEGTLFADAAMTEVWEKKETVIPAKIPGLLNMAQWEEIVRAAAEGSANAMRADFPLRSLLRIMLDRMWTDSAPRDEQQTLLGKFEATKWRDFGPVMGCPWQLIQLASQQMITPDQLLRQFGNMLWNEVIYGHDADTGLPTIIYRVKPFSRRHWSRLPMTVVSSDALASLEVHQSGAERFTYWRPSAAIASLQGLDMLIDTASGKLPIIEQRDILAAHGLRPAEPTDNHFPPGAQSSAPILEWYRRRIGIFRAWNVNNPEYLSGTATLRPANVDLRVGQRVSLPCDWEFQDRDRTIRTETIEAYVVGLTDDETVDDRGAATTSTRVQFVRGQPPGGLSIPPAISWASGAKRRMTINPYSSIERQTGAWIVVNGRRVDLHEGFECVHDTTMRAAGNKRARNLSDVRLLVMHHTGGSRPENTIRTWLGSGYSSHFVIGLDGQLWQLLDPATEAAIHVSPVTAGGATTQINRPAIGIDLCGGGGIEFTAAQYATFERLMPYLWAEFPALHTGGTGEDYMLSYPLRPAKRPDNPALNYAVADWLEDNGINMATVRGMFAHEQLDADKHDPSNPPYDTRCWDRLRAIAAEGPRIG